jgi:hypothetical protein
MLREVEADNINHDAASWPALKNCAPCPNYSSTSVFGYDPKSYRAEISGCKAGLLFISHVFSYCNLPLPPGCLQVHCDNEGFIKKMEKFRSYRIAAESCCLHSEWDMLIAVHRLFLRFPTLPSIHHIQGNNQAIRMDATYAPTCIHLFLYMGAYIHAPISNQHVHNVI